MFSDRLSLQSRLFEGTFQRRRVSDSTFQQGCSDINAFEVLSLCVSISSYSLHFFRGIFANIVFHKNLVMFSFSSAFRFWFIHSFFVFGFVSRSHFHSCSYSHIHFRIPSSFSFLVLIFVFVFIPIPVFIFIFVSISRSSPKPSKP